jgi:hypothetical protein
MRCRVDARGLVGLSGPGRRTSMCSPCWAAGVSVRGLRPYRFRAIAVVAPEVPNVDPSTSPTQITCLYAFSVLKLVCVKVLQEQKSRSFLRICPTDFTRVFRTICQIAPGVLQQASQHLLEQQSIYDWMKNSRSIKTITEGVFTVYSFVIRRLHFVICSCNHVIACTFETETRNRLRHAVQQVFELRIAPSLPKISLPIDKHHMAVYKEIVLAIVIRGWLQNPAPDT